MSICASYSAFVRLRQLVVISVLVVVIPQIVSSLLVVLITLPVLVVIVEIEELDIGLDGRCAVANPNVSVKLFAENITVYEENAVAGLASRLTLPLSAAVAVPSALTMFQ